MVFENVKATFLKGLTLVGSGSRKGSFSRMGALHPFLKVSDAFELACGPGFSFLLHEPVGGGC
jgi:hypothetical protein